VHILEARVKNRSEIPEDMLRGGAETGGVNTTTYCSSSEVACDYASLVECDGPLDTASTWDVAWGTENGSGAGDFLNTRGSVNLVRCARSGGGDM
jgi:hypothetical protein